MLRTTAATLAYLFLMVPAFAQSTVSGEMKPFHVKYVTVDSVYIDAGSAAGLAEGYTLTMRRPAPGEAPTMAKPLAELVVTSVASTSAVCDIKSSETRIEAGDLVFLSYESRQLVAQSNSSRDADNYAQVVMFTGPDPLEEELHESVPKPPLPEINHVNGRFAVDYDTIHDRITGARSNQQGMVIRLDMTRIGSTHWSLTGYWRGRLSARNSSPATDTLRDVLNRVYQIGLQYDSPTNPLVVGFGRLLLPWASSVSTIDGGYFGRKMTKSITAGVFAGSTPDPTAWNYDPNREIAGSFVNYNKGTFDGMHLTSTVGAAVTKILWQPDRQYAFAENGLTFKRVFSIHHNMEADYLSSGRFSSPQTVSLTRSFLTVRVQPVSRVSLDVSHNYFRVLPTFDPRLLPTGLLDNLLFQGLSGGVRFDLPGRVTLYSNAGQSHASTDVKRSWNTLYGFTLGQLPLLGIRLDARRSRFSSSFGNGLYDSVSVVKEISNRFRLDAMAGLQRFQSPFALDSPTRFVTATADWFVGRHATFGVGGSRYRGSQSYDQFNGNIGYRF